MGCTQNRQKQIQEQDPLPLINMLIVGLSGSGKSTILNQLKGEPQATCSQQLGIDSFIINKKMKIIAFQVAGRAINTWYNYYSTSNIVLFVIDSTQSANFQKIYQLLLDLDKQLQPKSQIILVFNKIDLLIDSNTLNSASMPANEETSHVTEYMDVSSAKVKQLNKFNYQSLSHEVYTCKCSAKDRIGVNNLMRKIFGLACRQVYGDIDQVTENR